MARWELKIVKKKAKANIEESVENKLKSMAKWREEERRMVG